MDGMQIMSGDYQIGASWMEETHIAWNPVPDYANHYFALGVHSLDIRVQYHASDGPETARMVVFAPKKAMRLVSTASMPGASHLARYAASG